MNKPIRRLNHPHFYKSFTITYNMNGIIVYSILNNTNRHIMVESGTQLILLEFVFACCVLFGFVLLKAFRCGCSRLAASQQRFDTYDGG